MCPGLGAVRSKDGRRSAEPEQLRVVDELRRALTEQDALREGGFWTNTLEQARYGEAARQDASANHAAERQYHLPVEREVVTECR
jgi:hypothetical protein